MTTTQTVGINHNSSLGLLNKVYVWSLIFEPLLFFMILPQTTSGVTGNVSRLLQLFVILGLVLRWLTTKVDQITIYNPFSRVYKLYFFYFLLVVVSGVSGVFMNAYSLDSYKDLKDLSFISRNLNGPAVRPFFEYFITIYYFFYFVVLPRVFIDSKQGVDYFFKTFFKVFVLNLILGYLDLLLISAFGYEWIPRDLAEGRHPGSRWHGIAGEPRDAFVYLLFGLAILNLWAYYSKGKSVDKKWIGLIAVTLILTQSASGLVGLIFAGGILFFWTGDRFSLLKFLQTLVMILFLFLLVYLGSLYSPRIMTYYAVFPTTWEAISQGADIPLIITGQMGDIYPLWDYVNDLIHLKFLTTFIGNGLGTAVILSNNLSAGALELSNPYSQFVRLLYESGIVGLLLFINSFIYPVKYLTQKVPKMQRKWFILIFIILLGSFFGHRSSVLFIFFGIFTLVFKRINELSNLNEQSSLPREK